MQNSNSIKKSAQSIFSLMRPLHLLLVVAIGAFVFAAFTTRECSSEQKHHKNSLTDSTIPPATAMPIPSQLDFCSEPVPLDRQDVLEAFDRELLVNCYWHSQTILFIKRANRYFPIIEPILKKNGVPDDFKYLCTIESSLMPRAISSAGAAGLWQILSKTGTELGLEVNAEVDERYHLEKSTEAACKYLKKAYDRYGSWTVAAASYNAGLNGIQRQYTRQKMDCYYDLLFGEETGRYVYRILAIKTILQQPEKYGFCLQPNELYPPMATIDYAVSGPIADFADFAQKFGTTYKELKDLNPWLRQSSLDNKLGKTYVVKLPLKSKEFVDKNQ